MRLLTGILLIFMLPAGSYSQAGASSQDPSSSRLPEQPQTVIKASTRLVIVDVTATNGKGEPVADLRESDFVVLEDGKPQKIDSFGFQYPGRTSTPAAAALPQNVVTNVPRDRSTSLNVILLDRVNGESSNRFYAQDQLIKYLESGVNLEPTAIFILEKKLTLVHDFTRDTKALKEALANARISGVSRVLDANEAVSPYATKGDFHTDENSIEVTLNALKTISRTLAGYPGRKNLIWVSEAFPVSLMVEGVPTGSSLNAMLTTRANDPSQPNSEGSQLSPATSISPGAGKSYAQEMARLSDSLMEAQIALYPVDAAGMGSANRIAAQSNMRDLADRTGGRAFYNRNDIQVGIGSSINDGSSYYAIAYYPENHTWNGQFRGIEIKTRRPDVTLRYRLGYYALDPATSGKMDSTEFAREFTQAMTFDSPLFAGVRFQAMVTPPAGSGQKAQVVFAIDPHSITFENKGDGMERTNVSCSVAVFTEKGKAVRNPKDETTSMSGALKPDEYQRMMRQYFPCKRSLDLKPGRYMLRLGAADMNGHVFGTSSASLVVQ